MGALVTPKLLTSDQRDFSCCPTDPASLLYWMQSM